MEFRPLHELPKYMKECAEVLNEEWKRSLTARLHSLEKSRDNFPICLVLLVKDEIGETRVVGHSRLSDVRGQSTKACLVESVVVKKSLRGKGYGRVVMKKTEEFAARKGYQTMYLTTHDKQDFYAHLGYEFCQPVVSLGTDILPDHLAEKLFGSLGVTDTKQNGPTTNTTSLNASAIKEKESERDTVRGTRSETLAVSPTEENSSSKPPAEPLKSPPPAPPPPVAPLPPSVAPPPPPVAPPPPPIACNKKSAGSETVVRWDPSKVSWMKKQLS